MLKKHRALLIAFVIIILVLTLRKTGYMTANVEKIKCNNAEIEECEFKKYKIKHRADAAKGLADNSLLLVFSGDIPKNPDYDYTSDRNFYYLTGINQDKTVLAILKSHGKVFESLFIKEPNPEAERWNGKNIRTEEAKDISGIEEIFYLKEMSRWLEDKIENKKIQNLYLDLNPEDITEEKEVDMLTAAVGDFDKNRSEYFATAIKGKYKSLKIRNANMLLTGLRTIKSEDEIENIKKAIAATNEGIKNIMKNAKPGIMEYELESYFDYILKGRGIKSTSFNTIMASGINSTILHYQKNNSRIEKGSLIMFDLGAQFNYYCADISRTIPAGGKFTERQRKIYNIVLNSQLETIRSVKPGIMLKDLQNTTERILERECKRIGLIKEDNEIEKYFYHAVTHHLGLHDHDEADYFMRLQPGMVITIEPGLYIKSEKTGIRIEDDVLVTKDGCEVLSKNIIKTPEEIEKYMEAGK